MSDYVLTPHAQADLTAIWTYTTVRWNTEQADRSIGLLHGAMRIAAAEPLRWRSCEHVRSGYFKYSAGSHVLYFRQHESGILLVRVLHQSMDFERHLQQE